MSNSGRSILLFLVGIAILIPAITLFNKSKVDLGYEPYKHMKIVGEVLYDGKDAYDAKHVMGMIIGFVLIIASFTPTKLRNFLLALLCATLCIYNISVFRYYSSKNVSFNDNLVNFWGIIVFGLAALYFLAGIAGNSSSKSEQVN